MFLSKVYLNHTFIVAINKLLAPLHLAELLQILYIYWFLGADLVLSLIHTFLTGSV